MMLGDYYTTEAQRKQAAQERAERLAAKRAELDARLARMTAREELTWDRVGGDE